jgi:hypothetical protein
MTKGAAKAKLLPTARLPFPDDETLCMGDDAARLHGAGLRGVPADWKGVGQPAAADGQLA